MLKRAAVVGSIGCCGERGGCRHRNLPAPNSLRALAAVCRVAPRVAWLFKHFPFIFDFITYNETRLADGQCQFVMMMDNGMMGMEQGSYGDGYMEPEEEWEREGLLDPAWEKQQKKVSYTDLRVQRILTHTCRGSQHLTDAPEMQPCFEASIDRRPAKMHY